MERYLLQPTKSVHIHVSHQRKKGVSTPLFMNNDEIPSVPRAIHLGIIRTDSMLNNQKANVDENLKKKQEEKHIVYSVVVTKCKRD
ncbi:hypothetical protein DPMN_012943 [Dreissena polymorpha]|uniref:Uncharacterized protein n=1 Tax=Dreissena polymorpha TaxID=45954 RepID=A0A9D4S375_DREPO|nr:hypothetical protein DPMN_012943 [Dreissena polymorpha]